MSFSNVFGVSVKNNNQEIKEMISSMKYKKTDYKFESELEDKVLEYAKKHGLTRNQAWDLFLDQIY